MTTKLDRKPTATKPKYKLPTTTQDISSYYPDVESPIEPFGDRVIVQIQAPRQKIGNIYLTTDTADADKWNQQTAKVRDLGPIAKDMGEKLGFSVGDFVRVPLYGGDKVEVPLTVKDISGGDGTALFVTYRAHEIIGKVVCDPLIVKTVV